VSQTVTKGKRKRVKGGIMGNSATIIFTDSKTKRISPAIYLHWNGGPESVYQFLDELDRRKVRADQCYEAARFIQIVGEFMDDSSLGGLSLGVVAGPTAITPQSLLDVETDHSDNGFYIICRENGRRTVRRFYRKYGQSWSDNKIEEHSKKWVADEMETAKKHQYYANGGFAAFFKKLHKGKKIEG